MSKQFKAGDKVVCVDADTAGILTHGKQYVVTGRLYCGRAGGNVITVDGLRPRIAQGFYERRFEPAPEVATPVGKVRILERGKLLDTEFDTPVAAGDWLRDNGITGDFELIRVESLGKVRASIKVEAA
jgi:hypothetical protein